MNISSLLHLTAGALAFIVLLGGCGSNEGPDLTMTAFTAPSTGTSGSAISISDTVSNVGTAAAGPFFLGLYLSTDDIISTADTLIATSDISAGLAAGESSAGSGSVTLPCGLAAGTYFLGVIADDLNEVSESNEANNVSNVVAITITAASSCPDLTVSSFTAPSTGTSGGMISVSDTVFNIGNAGAGPFSVGIYLSTDNIISTADTLVATSDISAGLAAGASSTGSGSVTLPSGLAAGTYFLGVIADDLDQVSEFNEANNVSNVVAITISP